MTTELVKQILDYPNNLELLQQAMNRYKSKPYVDINPHIIQVCSLMSRYGNCKLNDDNAILNPSLDLMLEKIIDSHLNIDYLVKHAKLFLENPSQYQKNVKESTLADYQRQIDSCHNSYKDNCESVRQIVDMEYKQNYEMYDFSFIIDNWNRKSIEDHWRIVEKLNLQSVFRNLTNLEDGLEPFKKYLLDQGKDYSSFEYMFHCKKMCAIAKNWDEFVEYYITQYADVLADLSKNARLLKIY